MDVITVLELLAENSFSTTRKALRATIDEIEELRALVILGGKVVDHARGDASITNGELDRLAEAAARLQGD